MNRNQPLVSDAVVDSYEKSGEYIWYITSEPFLYYQRVHTHYISTTTTMYDANYMFQVLRIPKQSTPENLRQQTLEKLRSIIYVCELMKAQGIQTLFTGYVSRESIISEMKKRPSYFRLSSNESYIANIWFGLISKTYAQTWNIYTQHAHIKQLFRDATQETKDRLFDSIHTFADFLNRNGLWMEHPDFVIVKRRDFEEQEHIELYAHLIDTIQILDPNDSRLGTMELSGAIAQLTQLADV